MKSFTLPLKYTIAYPPGEDTYLLIKIIELDKGNSFLDVGTGSGVIAIHAYKNGATMVTATDMSRAVLAEAKKNGEASSSKIDFVNTDLYTGICHKYNVIAFNPPYLPYDGWNEKNGYDQYAIGGKRGCETIERFLLCLQNDKLYDRAYFIYSSLSELDIEKFKNIEVEILDSLSFDWETIYAAMATRRFH